jgi:hypothetical protein
MMQILIELTEKIDHSKISLGDFNTHLSIDDKNGELENL